MDFGTLIEVSKYQNPSNLVSCFSLSFFPLHLQVCDDVAAQVLGKSVFVNWPHLEEARIIAVSDGDTK